MEEGLVNLGRVNVAGERVHVRMCKPTCTHTRTVTGTHAHACTPHTISAIYTAHYTHTHNAYGSVSPMHNTHTLPISSSSLAKKAVSAGNWYDKDQATYRCTADSWAACGMCVDGC